jgi:hypothetical protein
MLHNPLESRFTIYNIFISFKKNCTNGNIHMINKHGLTTEKAKVEFNKIIGDVIALG